MFNLRVLEWNDAGNGTTLNKEGKVKNNPKGLCRIPVLIFNW